MNAGTTREGTVVEFDEAVGLGVVAEDSDSGSNGSVASNGRYPFHCTQIVGGSRTIEVGTRVSFGLIAGRLGRWEAGGLRPLDPA